MTFNAGTKLGTYEISGLLGAGGMGEVYRARDSKLKRDVAIKILPEEFSRDRDRVSRFQREAEVLASLNHTNIAGIHDLEESNGSQYLVLELVEGETLAQRIARGTIPLEEALKITLQIAEALEAAHEKGVVHRDLKPANIKITPDGKVKVLDFGLAKAYEADASNAALSNSPTLSLAGTHAGVILGTAAYMSPEQAKGRAVDRRSDIFALGCVLYEMLTGRAAFEGDSVAQILARVLERDPDWSLLPKNVPPRIRELLGLCLEKNPKNRRSDASDVRIDIDLALRPHDAGIPVIPSARSGRSGWIAAAVFALIAVAGIVVALRPAQQAPEMRLEITTPATPLPLQFALSPDGRNIVFVASGDGPQRLWVRPLDKTGAQPLAGTEGAVFPFWSPDSRSLGFFASGKLKRVELAGGPPRALADAPLPRGGTWNGDGVILFTPSNTSPLLRVAAAGGPAVQVTQFEGTATHRFPQFLPDGNRFLYFVQAGPEDQGIYLGSLDGEPPARLTAADTAGAYLDPERIAFVRQGALIAQSVDLSGRKLVGTPEIIADPVGYDSGAFLGAFSVSADGHIAYRAGGAEQRQLTWFERSGKPVGHAGETFSFALVYPELSPNGQRLAIDRTVESNRDLWLMDLVRGGLTRLTFDAALDGFPVWSPDGSQIAFASSRTGTYDLYVKPSSGAGSEKPLLELPGIQFPQDWSRDGRFLLYFDASKGGDLWALPLTGNDRKPLAVALTPSADRVGVFSPDGRWVAYDTNESGRPEVMVQPFPNPTGKWQISTGGGSFPRWSRDGTEVYFIAPDGNLMAASVQASGSSFEARTPAALFQARAVGTDAGVGKPQYDVAADGRFLINQPVESAITTPITLILNWYPELK